MSGWHHVWQSVVGGTFRAGTTTGASFIDWQAGRCECALCLAPCGCRTPRCDREHHVGGLRIYECLECGATWHFPGDTP